MASVSAPASSIARYARPIRGEDELEQLCDLVAHARIVLLGSATYGTHEHYDLRSSITRKLVGQRGFAAVAIEADWPDALRVDRFVRNQSDDDNALDAFDHFPAWAYRNEDVVRFVNWLRIQNCCRRVEQRSGFYGLDLFSLNASIRAMRAQDVRDNDLLAELVDMQWRHAARSGRAPSGRPWLHAMRVRQAKTYYRTLFAGGTASWNLRSEHMADTIDMLASELGTPENPAKLVVWAHDGHVGDSRATSLQRHTLGQRMRERHHDAVALVGFTTHAGTVRLAESWDSPSVVAPLAPSAPESWEALFHDAGIPRFMITSSALRRAGEDVRLHRSVGATVRSEQYFEARLADHYDVIVHVDTTRAVDVVACADSTSMEFAGRSPRENHATQATLQAVPQAETGRARATADLKR